MAFDHLKHQTCWIHKTRWEPGLRFRLSEKINVGPTYRCLFTSIKQKHTKRIYTIDPGQKDYNDLPKSQFNGKSSSTAAWAPRRDSTSGTRCAAPAGKGESSPQPPEQLEQYLGWRKFTHRMEIKLILNRRAETFPCTFWCGTEVLCWWYFFLCSGNLSPIYVCFFYGLIKESIQKAVNFLLYSAPQIIACSGVAEQNKLHFVQGDASERASCQDRYPPTPGWEGSPLPLLCSNMKIKEISASCKYKDTENKLTKKNT